MTEHPMETHAADPIRSSAPIPANGLDSSTHRPEQDDDAERLRGVVTLPNPREILFTDEVELDAGTLPHWRPHIILDERSLTDDDHE